jgi:putative transposase
VNAPVALVSAAQLAQAMGVTKSTVLRRAAAESWAFAYTTGRGGSARAFLVEQLPPPVRAALIQTGAQDQGAAGQAGASEGARQELRQRLESAAAHSAREAALGRAGCLGVKAQARLDARLAVLRALEMFTLSRPGMNIKHVRMQFVLEYSAARVPVPDSVRSLVPSVSATSLERWQRMLRAAGVAALAGAYGNRRGSGLVDQRPAVRQFIEGMLHHAPHVRASQVAKALSARFGIGEELPSLSALERWLGRWRKANAELVTALANPDRWRQKYATAFGSYSADVTHINHRWELDSSPADVLCIDGRYCLIAGIDIFTRRVCIIVAKTSRATAVASLLRAMLLSFGVPDEVVTDNGAEYTSHHVVRVLDGLDCKHKLCEKFQPEQKPHIERFFGTFTRDLVELLPGFIGHNVAERKAVESRQQFEQRFGRRGEAVELRLTGQQLQAFCTHWVQSVYMAAPHSGLGDRTPAEMVSMNTGHARRIGDERALDQLLAEAPQGDGWRTVQKKGLLIDGAWFIAPELHAWVGHRVQVLFDAFDHDLGRVCVLGQLPHEQDRQFICWAECPERTGMDRRAVALQAKGLQRARVAQARQAMKAAARRQGTAYVVGEILQGAAAGAAAPQRLAAAGQVHDSAGLAATAAASSLRLAAPAAEADRHNAAQVEAARASLAAEWAERPKSPQVFSSPAERVQWLLCEESRRALTPHERAALAAFERAHPESFDRMKEDADAQQAGLDEERRRASGGL